MKFIFLFILITISQCVFSASIDIEGECKDYDSIHRLKFANGTYLECVDNSTMQSNKFVINDNNGITYEVDKAAKVVINDQVLSITPDETINYFISDTKDCNTVHYQRDYYYVYSRVPNGNSYCYALDGKFKNLAYVNLTGYLNLKILAKIKNDKVYLYKKEDKSFVKSRMYLVKGDLLVINEELGDWLNITFSGKKTVSSWIRKESIQLRK